MVNVNNNYRKNINTFWKIINGSVQSSKNKIETVIDATHNSSSSHVGKLKSLKSQYEQLGSELHMQSFDDTWKKEVCDLVKPFEAMYFLDSHFNGMLDQIITQAEVSNVVKANK